ncbi:M28 family peptidase [Paraburkholderia youngii]|uniref:Aminopeptidase YwaD n=1 Tax=Paraburkholderia youngii TaxID=2782701 RepID=A0A7W8LH08_9BURK|nr:M28 family peptidase [Paraburkholderia youngii]MBB5405459.1 aminopeptidase YwaD [Paraburkholderia youngii]
MSNLPAQSNHNVPRSSGAARARDIAFMKEAVERLCLVGEKISGTEAEQQACDYIVSCLEAFGLEARVHKFDAYIGFPTETALTLLGDEHHSLPAVGVAFGAQTASEGMEAVLVHVGRGREADYNGVDARGKIVLVDGIPDYDPAVIALEHGAVGMVFASRNRQRPKMAISPVWGSPASAEELARMARIPIVSIDEADGERLKAKLAESSVRVHLVARHEEGWRTVRMPVCEVAGREPEFVLVGAHYCSWFDGSTDNVASNVLLLALARQLAEHGRPLRYGVRFAWWPGHTQGRYAGSAWYADQFWQDLHDNAILYINVDGNGSRGANIKVARNQTGEISGFSARLLDELAAPIEEPERQWLEQQWRRNEPGIDISRPTRSSDQSFFGIGLSSLQIASMLPLSHVDRNARISGSGGAWWWHSSEETADKVGYEELADDLTIHAQALWRIADAAVIPFDFGVTAHDLLLNLAQFRHEGRGGRIERLIDAVSEFSAEYSRFRARGETLATEEETAPFNRIHLELARQLNPILYQRGDRFAVDPALDSRQLPGLEATLQLKALDERSEPARMLAITLTRQSNRVLHAILTATRIVRRAWEGSLRH